MIHAFNRKELITTYDIKKQAEVCDILAKNHMEYEYVIYVAKNNYENAYALIYSGE